MGRVTRTERNQQTARILARVADGEHVTITDRGRPVAELTPPAATAWDELIASGAVTPAREHGPLPFEPVPSETSVAATLADLRSERL
jgi:prevent-host-death family protein